MSAAHSSARAGPGRAPSTALAVLGQALAAVVAIGQARVIVVIAGEGVRTDAFLGAYSAYLPLGTIAATLRISGVSFIAEADADPARGGRAGEPSTTARITSLALVASAIFLLIGPLLALVVTRSLPGSAYGTAAATVCVLAVAALGHLIAAGYGALLSARGQLTTSNLIYGVVGLVGLGVSAAATAVAGPVGAAAGVATTAWLVLAAHLWVLRDEPRPWRHPLVLDRRQLGLVRGILAAAGIPVAVQLHLVVALAFAPREPNAVTAITYSFLFLSLVLASSFQVVGSLGMSTIAASRRRARGAPVERLVARGLPAAFGLAVPIALLALVAGPHLGSLVPSSVVPSGLVDTLFEYLGPFCLVAIPWGLQTILFSYALILGRTEAVLATVPLSFVVLIAALAIPGTATAWSFALAFVAAETVYAGLILRILFGGRLRAILAAERGRSVAILAVAGGIYLLGYDRAGLPLVAALVAAVMLFALGIRLSRTFDRWLIEECPPTTPAP